MIIGLLAIFGLWAFVASLLDWRRGMRLLLLYLPFAGVVSALIYPSPVGGLMKDVVFVAPIYMAFLISAKGGGAYRLPPAIAAGLLSFGLLLAVQAVNPSAENWLVVAVGLKVWLSYVPMLFVGRAFCSRAEDFVRLFRVIVSVAWVPAVIGIAELILSVIFGYPYVMDVIYGAAAAGATQNYAQFSFGGGVGGMLFRIPSTFTYVTQYYGYLFGMTVASYVLHRIESDAGWKRFALFTFWLVVIASFLSGARSAYIFTPMLVGLFYILEGRYGGLIIVGSGLLFIFIVSMLAADIDPIMVVTAMADLSQVYAQDIAYKGILDSLIDVPLGTGVGMNTGAARVGFPDPEALTFVENYYGKAIVELGVFGLLVVLFLFLSLILTGLRIRRLLGNSEFRSVSSCFVAFFITLALNSFKGWQIDLDPINVYFWFFAGLLLGLPRLHGVGRNQK